MNTGACWKGTLGKTTNQKGLDSYRLDRDQIKRCMYIDPHVNRSRHNIENDYMRNTTFEYIGKERNERIR